MTNRFHNKDGDQNNHYPTTKAEATCVLPAEDDIFLHREEELAWLDKHLYPDKVVAVCGPGGMGKTSLAARAVRRLPVDRFPDGIIFHSFYHQAETAKAVQTIALALGIKGEADSEQEVAAALGSKQVLLILDGAEEAGDLPAVLGLRGQCGVLITTRKKSDCGPLRLDLQPLSDEQSEDVLRAWTGESREQEAIEEIAELLGGWPVALRLAGHYLHSTGEPAADYLRWLQVELLMEKAQNGKNRAVGLDGIIQRSVDQLSKEARLALEIIGVLAFAPFREGANVALLKHFNHRMVWELCRLLKSLLVQRKAWLLHSTERDLRFCRKVLNELVDMGLLARCGKGWQVSHILIYTYAHKKMFLSDVTHKLLAWYYRDFFEKHSKAGPEGYALLDEERIHCLQVMESCLNREQWKEVQDLAKAIWEYLDQSGHWPEQLAAQKMRLTAARK
uniref:NB-ARC domain-containing protein n=1 Tax=Candidatus Electrothrix sp. TaxID=2170559 RepID=UPI004056A702